MIPLIGNIEESRAIMESWPIFEEEETFIDLKEEISTDEDRSENEEENQNENLYKKSRGGKISHKKTKKDPKDYQ